MFTGAENIYHMMLEYLSKFSQVISNNHSRTLISNIRIIIFTLS